MKTDAIIFGARGQDGQLMCSYLKKLGLSVTACSRKSGDLYLADNQIIKCISVDYTNVNSVINLLENVQPKYIFNFAGNASVGNSFNQPYNSQISYIIPLLSILEAARYSVKKSKILVANSGDIFGNNQSAKPNHNFFPQSPYAVARTYGANICMKYRDIYGLFIVNAFLFPHESIIRNKIYFLPKLASSLINIKQGRKKFLRLGSLKSVRDFGWAPEYLSGFWLSLNKNSPENYVFATGKGETLENIVKYALKTLNLNDDVIIHNDKKLVRNMDLNISVGNISDTTKKLGWKPQFDWKDILNIYFEHYKK